MRNTFFFDFFAFLSWNGMACCGVYSVHSMCPMIMRDSSIENELFAVRRYNTKETRVRGAHVSRQIINMDAANASEWQQSPVPTHERHTASGAHSQGRSDSERIAE